MRASESMSANVSKCVMEYMLHGVSWNVGVECDVRNERFVLERSSSAWLVMQVRTYAGSQVLDLLDNCLNYCSIVTGMPIAWCEDLLRRLLEIRAESMWKAGPLPLKEDNCSACMNSQRSIAEEHRSTELEEGTARRALVRIKFK